MNLELRKLSETDGKDIIKFLRNFPLEENGFYNPADPKDLVNEESFKLWVTEKLNEDKGINLKDGYVPQSIYWVVLNNRVVGIGKIRHYLNEHLLNDGGHIGLGLSKECRGNGVGTQALNLLLDLAYKNYGIEEVLLTNNEDNLASRRIVEKCGGTLESINNGKCKYWIDTKKRSKGIY